MLFRPPVNAGPLTGLKTRLQSIAGYCYVPVSVPGKFPQDRVPLTALAIWLPRHFYIPASVYSGILAAAFLPERNQ
jgi:hypothetical protein